MYSSEDKNLAHEIAEALNDKLSIGWYLKHCHIVPHEIMRDALAKVQFLPNHRVLTSRAAIFVSIIKAYLQDLHADTGN